MAVQGSTKPNGGSWTMSYPARHRETSYSRSMMQRARRIGLSAEQGRLLSQYPLFFRAVGNPRTYPSNIAHFGLQCGHGWFSLIASAASEIEQQLRSIWWEQCQDDDIFSSMEERIRSRSFIYPVLPFCSDIRSDAGQLTMEVAQGYLCNIDQWGVIHLAVKKAVRHARDTCESCGELG